MLIQFAYHNTMKAFSYVVILPINNSGLNTSERKIQRIKQTNRILLEDITLKHIFVSLV